MAWCLAITGTNVDLLSPGLWYSPKNSFTENAEDISHWMVFENYIHIFRGERGDMLGLGDVYMSQWTK